MNLKSLALISTSIVALGISSMAAQAASTTMGVVYLGFAEWWDNYDYPGSSSWDYNHPSVYGSGRVNIPYDTSTNVQVDVFGDASLHSSSGSLPAGALGNMGIGVHLNSRDQSQGLIGVFGATGRVWDVNGYNNSPVFIAGLEGQYFCGHWTGYVQAGYMDSDSNSNFMQNAGFVRVLVSYYANPRLKLTGGLGYIDGETDGYNANAWTYQADAQYWFGKSVPVAFTLKYEGRESQVHYSSSYNPQLNSNQVMAGFSLYFGGGSVEEADKTGAGTETPNFDWFRIPWD